MIFEISLRIIEVTPAWHALPVAEVSLYGTDEQAAYSHRKNISGIWITENRAKISTNALGIRSGGAILSDASKYFKVGIIGTSVTEALQVEDNKTFSAIIEKRLQARGHNIKVYNLGLSGATPAVEVIRSTKFAENLKLDLIIIVDDPDSLAHKIGNSSGGSLPYYKLKKDGQVVVEHPYVNSRSYKLKSSKVGDLVYFLIDHSRLVTVLNNRLNRGFFEELKSQLHSNKLSVNLSETECSTESISILKNIEEVKYNKNKKLISQFFDDLWAVKETSGVEIVFALYDSWSDCSVEDEGTGYYNVKRLAEKKSIEFFDLKKELKNEIGEGREIKNVRGFGVKKGTGHLNYKGHKIFADILERKILEKSTF